MKHSYNPDIEINKFMQNKSSEILKKNISEIKKRKNKFFFEEGSNGHRKSLELYEKFVKHMDDKKIKERLSFIKSKKSLFCTNNLNDIIKTRHASMTNIRKMENEGIKKENEKMFKRMGKG